MEESVKVHGKNFLLWVIIGTVPMRAAREQKGEQEKVGLGKGGADKVFSYTTSMERHLDIVERIAPQSTR